MSNKVKSYKAIILDRDDTLIVDVNWTYQLSDFQFVPGAPETVRRINNYGVQLFLATNQGGIGKGLYTERDMHRFHWFIKMNLSDHKAWIDDIAFCPHYPYPPGDEKACSCRKPNPGMISVLCLKWNLNPGDVALIGDKETDVQAAERAGADGFLFDGPNLFDFLVEQLPQFSEKPAV